MTPERYHRIRQVLDRRQPDLTVLMDNVHKPHNFSAVIRSCDAVGVLRVHGVFTDPDLQPLHHTSAGARRWVPVETHDTVAGAVGHLRENDFTIFSASPSTTALDYRACDYTQPTAILLGAELGGVSDQGLALADRHIAIPMTGMVQSLNVSVAAAVILFEAQRQRLQSGLYDDTRLEPSVYQRTLFEWLHPEVAALCRKHILGYPALDDEGAIVDFHHRGAGQS